MNILHSERPWYKVTPVIGGALMPDQRERRIETFWTTIAQLEARRKSQIFCVVHGDRPAHICEPDLEAVYSARSQLGKVETIEILLHSPGGDPDIAYQATKFLRSRCRRLNAIVPLMAKSAATLMCLGANAIHMGEFAELGPLDAQIHDPLERGGRTFSPLDEFKAMEFLRDYAVEVLDVFTYLFLRRSGMSIKEALHETIPCVTGMMRPLYERIDALKMGGYRRSLAVGEEYGRRLLEAAGHPDAQNLVRKLVWSYPTHTFVIDRAEAKAINLPVIDLDKKQENSILTALRGILEYGVSIHGFRKTPAKKPGGARRRRPEGREVPVPEGRPAIAVAG